MLRLVGNMVAGKNIKNVKEIEPGITHSSFICLHFKYVGFIFRGVTASASFHVKHFHKNRISNKQTK